MQFTEQQQDKLNKVQLDESWKTSLSEFLLSQKMDNLREFLQQEKLAEKTIYPPGKQIFSALNTTPLNEVKVFCNSSKLSIWIDLFIFILKFFLDN